MKDANHLTLDGARAISPPPHHTLEHWPPCSPKTTINSYHSFVQPSLLYAARTTVTMSTQEVPVETPFPDMNIDKQHGPVHVHSATATITRIAKSPPSKGFTTKVIRVVMSCTGNIDTDTILIENSDILRMFVEKEGKIVISFTQLPMMIPIWKLEPAGPMPDNMGEEDTDEDLQMIRNAWKTCRLVWGRHAGLEELNRRAAVTMRAMQKQDELAAQADNGKQLRSLLFGRLRIAPEVSPLVIAITDL